MWVTTWTGRLAVLAVLTLGLSLSTAEEKAGRGFKPLFNGKDLSGWKTFLDPKKPDADPAKTWTVEDGVIQCTGRPNGYFYTEKSFKNYVLRYDWKYLKPAEGQKSTYNSGLLIHM